MRLYSQLPTKPNGIRKSDAAAAAGTADGVKASACAALGQWDTVKMAGVQKVEQQRRRRGHTPETRVMLTHRTR